LRIADAPGNDGASRDAALLRPLGGFRPGLIAGTLVTGALAALLFGSWAYQIAHDLGVSGLRRPVYWGFYITNFVFWIGISHAGTLISAILRVTSAGWRRPVTRCAEAITVFAIAIGGLFPLIHLGRPWLFYYMLPLPNDRMLWPNFRAPLMWDVAAISTYLVGSSAYLLLPLIPDMAILRDRFGGDPRAGLKVRFFTLAAAGWRGTPRQWHALEEGIRVMAVIIIPVAVSVHSIVAWDFAITLQPMWHSTIFAPYFVVGAIYSGIAMLLLTMYLLRRGLGLEGYLSDTVFNNLGLLLVTMSLIWGYFTFAEHLTVWYGDQPAESAVFDARVSGAFAPAFWTMIVLNVLIPVGVLAFRRGRRPAATALVAVGVIVGMWLERFLIVVGTLSFPRLPYTPAGYSPSWVELGVLVGSFGLFGLLYFVFLQLAPIVSIWEVREGQTRAADESVEPASGVDDVDHGATSRFAVDGDGDPTPRFAVNDAAAARAVLQRLAASGIAAGAVEVRSSHPLVGEPRPGEPAHRSRVVAAAVAGGLMGATAAVALVVTTTRSYDIQVGGLPAVAVLPTMIIAFEGMALGAILATVAAVLRECRLPDLRWRPDPLDRQLAGGKIVIRVQR
jgi:molybdopterin-containing oxidoreductase family membrane subunit